MGIKPEGFSFFPDNWLAGTILMTDVEKGIYIDLLCIQFMQGHLSQDQINRRAGEHWEGVKSKFKKDSDGNFFNERIEESKQKAIEYKNSRLKNLKGIKKPHMASHMGAHKGVHMEKEKEKEKENKKGKEKKKEITAPLVYPWTDEKFTSIWQIWKDYKKEQYGFIYKPMGEQAVLKELSEVFTMDQAIARIQLSIANGWKGLVFKNDREASGDSKASREEVLKKGADYLNQKYKR